VETPWDFWYLSKGEKPKLNEQQVDLSLIQKIWQSKDVQAWHNLSQAHVPDVKLAAFVHAEHVDSAKQQVTQLFPDAEWHKCVQVDEATKQQIIQLFGATLSKAA
jgi:hypothetical protein